MVDKVEIRSNLKLPLNSQITLFNDNYDIILNITEDNISKIDSPINEVLKHNK